MEREYKCIDCGKTFVRDTKIKSGVKRCPDCRRKWARKLLNEWRQKQRIKALTKMKNKV